MRRELAEELGLECEELEQLRVMNRFVYPNEYKQKRDLDHDGQDAVMFFGRLRKDCALRRQKEEVAAARWFEPNEAAAAFPVANQRTVFQECMIIAA